jgi:hypothetical protein
MNPELRRNLWMEFSLHRLIAMPAVLALVFALFASMKGWAEGVYMSAIWGFVLLAYFWGSRQASGSVTDEVRERTWDWQRLSALTPWQMTWGKLFGAPAFTWYGAAICLVVIVITTPPGNDRGHGAWIALALAASAIGFHAAAIASSLEASRKDSRLSYRIGGLLMIPVAFALLGAFSIPWWQDAKQVTWYGSPWDAPAFGALSAVVFAAWAVLGAFREMSRELKVRTLPWALPAFIVFVAAYAAGFEPQRDATERFLLAGIATSIALTYYTLFADLTTLMLARRIATHARAGNWQRVLEELPLWVIPLATAAVFAILLALTVDSMLGNTRLRSLAVHPIAGVLLVTRDAGLLVFFALGARPRRVEAVLLFYLVLLYWLVPSLLASLGARDAAGFVLPFGKMGGWQAAVVALIHAAIAWGLVAWRWHRAQESFRPV